MKFREYLKKVELNEKWTGSRGGHEIPKPTIKNPKDFAEAIQKADENEKVVLYTKYSSGWQGKKYGPGELYVTFVKLTNPEYYQVQYQDSVPDDEGQDFVKSSSGDPSFKRLVVGMRDELKNKYGISDIGRF